MIEHKDYNFCGWIYKDNMAADMNGHIVYPGAIDNPDHAKIPLMWSPPDDEVLGAGELEKRDGGIYFYGKFHDNDKARGVLQAIQDKRIQTISLYANNVKYDGQRNVTSCHVIAASLPYWHNQPEEYRDTLIEWVKEGE